MISREERDFLRRMIAHNKPLMPPVDIFNGNNLGNHSSDKLIHKLISEGYINEVPQPFVDSIHGIVRDITYYRVSAKGYLVFAPTLERAWAFFTDDIAKVLSVIAIIISIIVGLKQIGVI